MWENDFVTLIISSGRFTDGRKTLRFYNYILAPLYQADLPLDNSLSLVTYDWLGLGGNGSKAICQTQIEAKSSKMCSTLR